MEDTFVEEMEDDKPLFARDLKRLLAFARWLQVGDVPLAEIVLAGQVRRLKTLGRLFSTAAGPELDADASDEGEDDDKGKTSAGTGARR
eukprot:m51a1_g4811 hypothetical protein (89) ;mRNA; r:134877-135201